MITLDEIRARAGKSRVRIRWRNILLGGYSLLAVLVMARALLAMVQAGLPQPGMTAVVAALLAAHAWILFALWWRRPQPVPTELNAQAALDFHRRELEQQHRAAASAWAWYILPFVPVTLLALVVGVQMMPPEKITAWLISGVLLNVLWYGVIWLLFSRSATRIVLELERLGRLRAE